MQWTIELFNLLKNHHNPKHKHCHNLIELWKSIAIIISKTNNLNFLALFYKMVFIWIMEVIIKIFLKIPITSDNRPTEVTHLCVVFYYFIFENIYYSCLNYLLILTMSCCLFFIFWINVSEYIRSKFLIIGCQCLTTLRDTIKYREIIIRWRWHWFLHFYAIISSIFSASYHIIIIFHISYF